MSKFRLFTWTNVTSFKLIITWNKQKNPSVEQDTSACNKKKNCHNCSFFMWKFALNKSPLQVMCTLLLLLLDLLDYCCIFHLKSVILIRNKYSETLTFCGRRWHLKPGETISWGLTFLWYKWNWNSSRSHCRSWFTKYPRESGSIGAPKTWPGPGGTSRWTDWAESGGGETQRWGMCFTSK